jgi:hypothetical protein
MAWAVSIFHTERCSKRATRVVIQTALHASDENLVTEIIVVVVTTAVVIEAHEVEVATEADAAETVVAEVVIEADAVVVVVAVVTVMIVVHAENDVTSTMIADHVTISLTETMMVAEIAVLGVLRVVMMAVAVDQVRHADAKLSN